MVAVLAVEEVEMKYHVPRCPNAYDWRVETRRALTLAPPDSPHSPYSPTLHIVISPVREEKSDRVVLGREF